MAWQLNKSCLWDTIFFLINVNNDALGLLKRSQRSESLSSFGSQITNMSQKFVCLQS